MKNRERFGASFAPSWGMQKPLQITVRGMEPSAAVEQRVREKVANLARFELITSCHVTIEAPHRHHQQGSVFSVHVDIHVPDKQLAYGRTRHHDRGHEDVYVAIRDAFEAAERGLEQYARDRRAH
jgi:ribosome-associated translation inhibitor RaiA